MSASTQFNEELIRFASTYVKKDMSEVEIGNSSAFVALQRGVDHTTAKDHVCETIRRMMVPSVTDSANNLNDGLDEFFTSADVTVDPLPLLPDTLKNYPNWVTWESLASKGPRISGSERNAKSDDSTTWVSYPTAVKNIEAGHGFKNLGFVTNGKQTDNLCGIDIDGCCNFETGQIADWARQIVDLCASYCEITPSGTGLRVWIKAELPANYVKKYFLALSTGFGGKVQVEVFNDGLYFTVTGNRFGDQGTIKTLSTDKTVELFNLLDDLRKQYPPTDGPRQEEAKKHVRARAIRNPDGTVTFVPVPPDDGFKMLFDHVGWKPLIDRLEKMDDTRFHNPVLEPGKMMFCPMPRHGVRGKDIKYTAQSFGVVSGCERIVHCFGCDWTGDLVKTVKAFDAGVEGGSIEYPTMYDCAKTICEQENLNFNDFFESQTSTTASTQSELSLAQLSSDLDRNPDDPNRKPDSALTDEEYEAELDKEFPVIPLNEQPGPSWSDDILYGLSGEVIRKASQYNEAHPAGMLLDFLVAFGNMIGRGPYFNINSTRHYTNEFLARIGDSSYSRKGGGRDAIDEPLKVIDPIWFRDRVMSGFGSPEAIISNLRDGSVQQRQNKKTGVFTDCPVPGILDKRLCIRESELASVFVLASKADSRCDIVLREGWDGKALRNLVKGKTDGINNSAVCMEPHLSISGDTTRHELVAKMPDGADENGFGNRFLYCYVYRVKLCPVGGPDIDWTNEVVRLHEALEFARHQKYVPLSASAKNAWIRMYTRMDDERLPGMAGKMTSRGPAHVRRLALIYALIDKLPLVELKHLRAAEHIWEYCQESARYIFNKYTREQLKILKFVEQKGTTDLTAIREELFHRHKLAGWIKAQVGDLVKAGYVWQTDDSVKFIKR